MDSRNKINYKFKTKIKILVIYGSLKFESSDGFLQRHIEAIGGKYTFFLNFHLETLSNTHNNILNLTRGQGQLYKKVVVLFYAC